MVFKAKPCKSRWEGLLVTSWILLVDLLLLIWILRRPVDWLSFLFLLFILLSLPLVARLAYRTWALFNLEYWLDRDALTVRWGASRQVIPLTQIRRIIQGGGQETSRPSWTSWPGPYVRLSTALGMLNVQRYATRPLAECLLLETDETTFALSPMDPAHFLETLQAYYQLGPAHAAPAQGTSSGLCQGALFRDRLGVALLLLGLVGILLLFGTLMVRYPEVPDLLAIRYNIQGQPQSVRPKASLFLLPAMGLLVYLINGAWGGWLACRRQRLAAYLLWGGAVTVQLFTFLALVNLIL